MYEFWLETGKDISKWTVLSMWTRFQLTTMAQKQEYSKISRGNMNIMFIWLSTFPPMVVAEFLFWNPDEAQM